MRIRRATHKDDAGSGERRGSDEPEVVQLDEAQLGQRGRAGIRGGSPPPGEPEPAPG